MKTRYMIIKEYAKVYKKARKKQKTEILDLLTGMLSMSRNYIAYLLRNTGKIVSRKGNIIVISDPTKNNLSKRGRKKVYGEEVLTVLKIIWRISGYISSKHLVWYIHSNQDILFKQPKIKEKLTPEIKWKLLKISASTIDRLLKSYRDKVKFDRRKGRNPYSSNLKKSIKVESIFDKPKVLGYVEVDLVHHSGASQRGEFIYTLTCTEITTGWTELEVLKNKAMIWTARALENIFKRLPMDVKILHSDNGSEFLNAHIQRICRDKGIEMSRSRPYKKNDSAYVESKNWSMVRAYTGWLRYDTEEEFKILRRLLRLVSLRNNIFIPQMKVKERERVGRKVIKRYDIDTPLNRVLRSEGVSEEKKEELWKLRSEIDIVELSQEIERLQEELYKAYKRKSRRRL